MPLFTALTALLLMTTTASPILTVADVEQVSGLAPLHTTPKNQATGAGGELNFADAENKLVLMVMIQPTSTFDFWRKQYGAKAEKVAGIGSEAFRSKTGEFISYIAFLKGQTGVWLQTMGWKKNGGANFTAAQLETLAKLAASRL